jgi:hypothetical protein
MEGPELGYIIVCFLIRKTTSELKYVIFTTLFLLVKKTPTILSDKNLKTEQGWWGFDHRLTVLKIALEKACDDEAISS